jgi:glycosyltransferase 2 family protein
MRSILTKLGMSAAIAAALVYWLSSQGFQVLPGMDEISSVTAAWAIPVYVGVFALFHMLRAWRWFYLLRPFAKVNISTMMEVAFLGFAAIQMMPLRTGEVARPYLLDKYAGISKSALFGTIAIERVIDGLIVSLLLSAALFTVPSERSSLIWGLRTIPLLIFVVALSLLVAFYFRPVLVKQLIRGICRLVSQKLADFAIGVLERFHAGLAALPNHRNFWAFVIISILYWGINGVGFFLLARGCGVMLPMAGALAGMGCLAVGILLPAGPGYFGNFQVAVLTAVEIYLPVVETAKETAVFVFLLYVLQTGLTILFAAGGMLRLKRKPHVSRPHQAMTTSFEKTQHPEQDPIIEGFPVQKPRC